MRTGEESRARMSDWREVALGELCSMASGKVRPDESDGPYPVYGSNGQIGWSRRYTAEDGIVVGRVGAYCGSLKLVRTRFWATDNTIVLLPTAGIDLGFLFFALREARLPSLAGGSAQPLITQGRLKTLRLRVPDGRTQERIATVLGAFDDLIEINERRMALCEELVRSLYREWFVRFRYPQHELVGLVDS